MAMSLPHKKAVHPAQLAFRRMNRLGHPDWWLVSLSQIPSEVCCAATKLFLDPQQLVVLRHTV